MFHSQATPMYIDDRQSRNSVTHKVRRAGIKKFDSTSECRYFEAPHSDYAFIIGSCE